MSLDQVLAAVANQRSLWVELECPTLMLYCPPEVQPVTDPLHCTVTFHGKGLFADQVKVLYDYCCQLNVKPFDSRLSGVARFRGNEREGDPIVWLVSDIRIRELKQQISAAMGMPISDWDYTPHITLGRIPISTQFTFSSPTPTNRSVHFTSLAICAGEDRVSCT